MEDKEFLDILKEIDFVPSRTWYEDWNPELAQEEQDYLQVLYDAYFKHPLKNSNNAQEAYKIWRKESRNLHTARLFELGIGEYDKVHEEGGGEGEGEYVELVVHFPLVDKYVQATAAYYSYNGIDYWEDWTIVRPYEETIIVYR